jgi:hypothetical protein
VVTRRGTRSSSVLTDRELVDEVTEQVHELQVERRVDADGLPTGLRERGEGAAQGMPAARTPAPLAAMEGPPGRALRILAEGNRAEAREEPVGIEAQQVAHAGAEEVLVVRVRHPDPREVEPWSRSIEPALAAGRDGTTLEIKGSEDSRPRNVRRNTGALSDQR